MANNLLLKALFTDATTKITPIGQSNSVLTRSGDGLSTRPASTTKINPFYD